jgi:hypothetical protein
MNIGELRRAALLPWHFWNSGDVGGDGVEPQKARA